MAKKQKESVIEEVLVQLPTFSKYKDNALALLTPLQLENVKNAVHGGILAGTIEYGKDLTNLGEVRNYARSMVMNHLKKAKELNGGNSSTPSLASGDSSPVRVQRVKEKIVPKGVNLDLLPEDLKEYAKTLV